MPEQSISQITRLSHDERERDYRTAQEEARRGLREPKQSSFKKMSERALPRYVYVIILVVVAALAFAGGYVSYFRVAKAGYDLHLSTFTGKTDQARDVGRVTFALAEALAMAGILVSRALFAGFSRALIIAMSLMGVAMAFIANWTVIRPHTAFGWLDTFSPPLVYLACALILEQALMRSIEGWRTRKREYDTAMAVYLESQRNPEGLSAFRRILASRLLEALRAKNPDSAGLPIAVWRQVVGAEIADLSWYERLETDVRDTDATSATIPLDPELAALQGQRRVLAYVKLYGAEQWDDLAELARQCHVSVRTVQRAREEAATRNGKLGIPEV